MGNNEFGLCEEYSVASFYCLGKLPLDWCVEFSELRWKYVKLSHFLKYLWPTQSLSRCRWLTTCWEIKWRREFNLSQFPIEKLLIKRVFSLFSDESEDWLTAARHSSSPLSRYNANVFAVCLSFNHMSPIIPRVLFYERQVAPVFLLRFSLTVALTYSSENFLVCYIVHSRNFHYASPAPLRPAWNIESDHLSSCAPRI